MNLQLLSDYYPVYQDLFETNPAITPTLFSGDELIGLISKAGYNDMQAAVILVKNAFEGHALLTSDTRPDKLVETGTILFQTNPAFLLASFHEQIDQYRDGLIQLWSRTGELRRERAKSDFNQVINGILINQLIRFPVSLLASVDLVQFADTIPISNQSVNLRLDLITIAEKGLGEYSFSENVSYAYAEKFRDLARQVLLKEEVLKHYQRKLELALFPSINSEEELEEWMYRQLVNEKLNSNPKPRKAFSPDVPGSAEDSSLMDWIKENIKFLYRSVSKNCAEIHSTTDGENRFPELHQAFLEANSIYIETDEDLAEVVLRHARLVALLARVVCFRKTNGYDLAASLQPVAARSDYNPFITPEELQSLKQEVESKLAAIKIRNYTDYKLNFVMFDDLTDIHRHYLQKQLDYMDQQILKIQADIKTILWQKANITTPRNPFKPEDLL